MPAEHGGNTDKQEHEEFVLGAKLDDLVNHCGLASGISRHSVILLIIGTSLGP
jgi:hypothetical protein